MASRAILSNFFEEKWTQNYPQYLSGLSRALFPTTFLEIAVYIPQLYINFPAHEHLMIYTYRNIISTFLQMNTWWYVHTET